MKILISNDDGYQAEGIQVLTKYLAKDHQVVVVAPNENKSASSSSLTLNQALKPVKIDKNIYSIDATPSDCVHLALCGFLKEEFDLVVTGINFGPNLGDDVIYSGTVAGAIEGRFLGLPSVAISLASWEGENFETAGKVAQQIINQLHTSQLSQDTVLNINVPDIAHNEIQGFQTTRLGKRHMSEASIPDEKDSSSYWIGENGKEADNGVGTDFHAIANNYVSVTPLQIDLTKYNEIDTVSDWLKDLG
ncbi:5'-nucleotidase SurE (EC 3.1.3.5) [uncultured Gammaproteobacteria bacterium]|uniref:5'/3'-nucleotidase SurE n=1 Tax=Bathymodiolus heckerae thiotrophic gill symbiont TaxID=1052212 RepID=UPI0010B445A0|nr:5'/3'-nucleotidase SurE [Bathymodiolus heckerae thiotrophic gill symbiont]CAC9602828.1 5'-nucleotidase SurE (EC 3.1.3.5) [uncultured Gammaproteobacteria bacterium]CAC9605693.1 5'-nucleotidase SurE (EC 3.1.3.5) [uncultured Gammaproteobacteria bacterium]CAC9606794.1 5'-nucleotidase SurE (EC 3.1.3.5) [uncultured Gammaproteobacteria bacterium]SHN91030.1 5-nucleotidase SurE [Bathymodiolus heckerae thiotrophic gill symbiont]